MSEAAEKTQRRPYGWIVMAVLILAGIIVGVHYYHLSLIRQSTDDAYVKGHITSVSPRVSGQVIKVLVHENEIVKQGQLLFVIDPKDYQTAVEKARSALAAARSRLTAARVQLRLSQESSRASLTQSTGSLQVSVRKVVSSTHAVDVAAAQVQQARAAIRQARAEVLRSQAEGQVAATEAHRLHKDFKRYALLFADKEISEQRYDAARDAALGAESKLDASQEAVRAAQAQLQDSQAAYQVARQALGHSRAVRSETQAGVGEAQGRYQQAKATRISVAVAAAAIKTAKDEMKQARATLQQARLNLSYTRVYAPVTGQTARKNLEPGQFVQPGSPVIAIVDQQGMWVDANFKETQMDKIRVGDRADIRVDAYPGADLKGSVESIQPGTGAVFSLLPPENASGNFVKVVQRVPVRIHLSANQQGKVPIQPGMSVEATVWLQ